MSLKYRDSHGNETPVAGLNGTSGELVPSVALYQKGTKVSETTSWVPGDSGIFSIAFSTPMPDTSYDVILGIDTPEITVSAAYDKSVNGFKAKVENVSSVTYAGRIELSWQAFKLMTDEVHEADSAHIAQNTANFAPAFSDVTRYDIDSYVTYNNILYRCTTGHTAGAWVAGHFTPVTVGGDLMNDVSHKTNFWEWNNETTYTLDFLTLWTRIGIRYGAQLICYSTLSDGAYPKLHIFAVAATAIEEGFVSITDVGGDGGFSATVSGHSITITAPHQYNTAKLLY